MKIVGINTIWVFFLPQIHLYKVYFYTDSKEKSVFSMGIRAVAYAVRNFSSADIVTTIPEVRNGAHHRRVESGWGLGFPGTTAGSHTWISPTEWGYSTSESLAYQIVSDFCCRLSSKFTTDFYNRKMCSVNIVLLLLLKNLYFLSPCLLHGHTLPGVMSDSLWCDVRGMLMDSQPIRCLPLVLPLFFHSM